MISKTTVTILGVLTLAAFIPIAVADIDLDELFGQVEENTQDIALNRMYIQSALQQVPTAVDVEKLESKISSLESVVFRPLEYKICYYGIEGDISEIHKFNLLRIENHYSRMWDRDDISEAHFFINYPNGTLAQHRDIDIDDNGEFRRSLNWVVQENATDYQIKIVVENYPDFIHNFTGVVVDNPLDSNRHCEDF